jgi:hypothetical protein
MVMTAGFSPSNTCAGLAMENKNGALVNNAPFK